MGHSHTQSKIPLPNWYDIETGILNMNSKYNMIYAPGFGVTIIKQSSPTDKPNKKKLKESYNKANHNRKNYVNNNITHMADEYKKEIKDNYRISMIQKKRDINEIKDIIRHSNLKEQCEFYNKELKKHGVELIYINP
ncbi:hypothetical protein SAMN05216439_1779 [Methanobrevibacter gottschalkii]|uniref:Uncharacterized protein n=2 Tax=Methanobrevibacter gottschalkii TaxID=190974 RepID=A0A1H7LMF6_9EURY|nr:hypothetical protein [archaeon]SEL00029.1 hypothetical protein SAMN05216439_1779 [Methanobrevibacter gottschalkii]